MGQSAMVWVPNSSKHDLTAAEKFGIVRVVISGIANPFDLPLLGGQITDALAEFKPDDYLLLAGNLVVNVMAVAHLLAKLPKIKLLIFNAKERVYYDRVITREDINA